MFISHQQNSFGNLKSHLRSKVFVWLAANKKVSINDSLHVRKSHKVLSPKRCTMHMMSDMMIDHLFLHYLMTIVLWHRLFNMVKLDWVLPKSISNMMTISFKGLESISRGKTLWKINCLTLICLVWKRNITIFNVRFQGQSSWHYSTPMELCK